VSVNSTASPAAKQSPRRRCSIFWQSADFRPTRNGPFEAEPSPNQPRPLMVLRLLQAGREPSNGNSNARDRLKVPGTSGWPEIPARPAHSIRIKLVYSTKCCSRFRHRCCVILGKVQADALRPDTPCPDSGPGHPPLSLHLSALKHPGRFFRSPQRLC
jgi:hypothetical protein